MVVLASASCPLGNALLVTPWLLAPCVDGGSLRGRRSADATLPECALELWRRPPALPVDVFPSGICRAVQGREARKFGAVCDLGAEADASPLSDGNGLLDERRSGCRQPAAGLFLCPWARRKARARRWQQALSAAPAAPGMLALRRSESLTKVVWQPSWTTRIFPSSSSSGRSFTTAAAVLRTVSAHDRHVVVTRRILASTASFCVRTGRAQILALEPLCRPSLLRW